MATDLERMIVRLEASLTQFDREMRKATGIADRSARTIETRFAKMNASISKSLGAGAMRFAAPFLGLAGAKLLIDRTSAALKDFSDIADAAQSTGLSTDFYQTLTAAGLEYGATQESTTNALLKFIAAYGAAKEGTGVFISGLKKTNPELLRLLQTSGSVEEAIRHYADAVKNSKTAEDQARLGKIGFGRSFATTTRVMALGSEGLTQYAEDARKLGLIVDAKLIQKADVTADKFEALSRVLSLQVSSALVDLGPVINDVVAGLADILRYLFQMDDARMIALLENQLSALTEDVENYRKTLQSRRGTVVTDEDLMNVEAMRDRLAKIKTLKEQIRNIKLGELSFEDLQKPGFGRPPLTPTGGDDDGEAKDLAAEKAAARLTETVKDAKQALTDKAEGERADALAMGMSTEAALAYRTELDTINQLEKAGVTITPQLAAQVKELSKNYAEAANNTEALGKAQQFFEQTAGDALKTFVQGLREGKTAMEALEDVLAGVADKLIDLALNLAIAGISKGVGAAGGFNALAPAFVQHRGGPAGTGPMRRVPAALFAGAPRLHSGGYIGAGEIPAILQRGETVIPRGGSVGSQTNVTINNYSDEKAEKKERKNSSGGLDIEVMIGNVVARQAATPGTAVNRTLGSVFGLKPTSIRR